MKCPICGQIDCGYWRGFIVGISLGILFGFMGGHLFYHFQIKSFYAYKAAKSEESLKNFAPPPPSKTTGIK